MWKKGKNLVYIYKKLSILSFGGARLIFMNSSKCPTKWLIKKLDVVLSSRFAWRYSFSQLSIRTLVSAEYKDSSVLKNNDMANFEALVLKWNSPFVTQDK